jgi:hypothetical protein
MTTLNQTLSNQDAKIKQSMGHSSFARFIQSNGECSESCTKQEMLLTLMHIMMSSSSSSAVNTSAISDVK